MTEPKFPFTNAVNQFINTDMLGFYNEINKKIDENYETKLIAVENKIVFEYLKQARINLNIRQVN